MPIGWSAFASSFVDVQLQFCRCFTSLASSFCDAAFHLSLGGAFGQIAHSCFRGRYRWPFLLLAQFPSMPTLVCIPDPEPRPADVIVGNICAMCDPERSIIYNARYKWELCVPPGVNWAGGSWGLFGPPHVTAFGTSINECLRFAMHGLWRRDR